MRVLFVSCLFACTQVEDETGPTEPEFQFAMAVVADSHLGGSAEPAERLRAAVTWINDHRESRQIDIVPVLGDIGWGEGLVPAKEILDELAVPYVPVLGDNEVYFGDEERFNTVFANQYDLLADHFEDWRKSELPVWNPEHEKESHFQTFAFSHMGLDFVVLDWASRSSHVVLSEMAERHDFEGGVWPWFVEHLDRVGEGLNHHVVFLTHNPMFMGPGGFSYEDFGVVSEETLPHDQAIWANLAGHLHFDGTIELTPEAGYDVHLIDALWDDLITIQVVEVYRNSEGFSFVRENFEMAH